MSYANGTTHYNLPQTVGTDKRDWFDSNAAFAAVDAALYAAATGQASDAEAITALQQTVAGQATDIAGLGTLTGQHTSQIAALNTTVNNLGTEVSDVRQDAEDMITANNEGAAATSTRAYSIGEYFIYNDVLYKATAAIAVGDTIVPNTNCVATNVDTELTQVNSDLGDKVNNSVINNTIEVDIKKNDEIIGTVKKIGSIKRYQFRWNIGTVANQTYTYILSYPDENLPNRKIEGVGSIWNGLDGVPQGTANVSLNPDGTMGISVNATGTDSNTYITFQLVD